VSKNSVLKKIFEIKTGEIIGGSRKIHKEELHDSYASTYFIISLKLWRV